MTRNQMRTKGIGGLVLAFMLMFANSLPVFATSYTYDGLERGDVVEGGDWIEAANYDAFAVYIDGVNMYNGMAINNSNYYTMPSGRYSVESKEYTDAGEGVTVIVRLTTINENNTAHTHLWSVDKIVKEVTPVNDAIGIWSCSCGATKQEAVPNTSFATFLDMGCDEILNAEENGTVEIDTGIWGSLRDDVIEAIKEREDLTVKITLTHEKEQYLLVFGPNRDMSMLEEADWYGVLYLNQFFGVEPEADAE